MLMKTKNITRLLSVVLAVVFMFSGSVAQYSFAVDLSDDEQAEIDNYREQQQAIKDKIEAAQKKIDELKANIEDEEAYCAELDVQIGNYQKQIDALNEGIAELESEKDVIQVEIDKLSAEISKVEDNIARNETETVNTKQEIEDITEKFKERLCEIYVNGATSDLELLLDCGEGSDFTTYLIMLEMSQRRAESDEVLISGLKGDIEKLSALTLEYQAMIEDIEVKRSEHQAKVDVLSAKQQEIEASKSELVLSQDELEALQIEAFSYIESLDRQSETYNNLVEKYEQDIQNFENKIDEIIRESSSSGNADITANPGGFIWPLQYSDVYVSSAYGNRYDPISGVYKFHGGTDTCCWSGTYGKSVVASADGTVIISTFHNSYGYYVGIDHGDGIVTIYAHNSQLLVSVGQTVKQGQTIAYAGSTGYSTGAHCHFEVRLNGERVQPLNYVSLP